LDIAYRCGGGIRDDIRHKHVPPSHPIPARETTGKAGHARGNAPEVVSDTVQCERVGYRGRSAFQPGCAIPEGPAAGYLSETAAAIAQAARGRLSDLRETKH